MEPPAVQGDAGDCTAGMTCINFGNNEGEGGKGNDVHRQDNYRDGKRHPALLVVSDKNDAPAGVTPVHNIPCQNRVSEEVLKRCVNEELPRDQYRQDDVNDKYGGGGSYSTNDEAKRIRLHFSNYQQSSAAINGNTIVHEKTDGKISTPVNLPSTPPSSLRATINTMPLTDIYGRVPGKEPKHTIPCPNCGRQLSSSRLALHLEKCLGLVSSSRRGSGGRGKLSAAAAAAAAAEATPIVKTTAAKSKGGNKKVVKPDKQTRRRSSKVT
jgi:hypothetical protein